MPTPFLLPTAGLRLAVDAIQERAENLSLDIDPSHLFVDTALLPTLAELKNQVIYGRRGTGKTHLLLRLAERYRDAFPEDRVLPVYVDGRTVKHTPLSSDTVPVSLLIAYRRLLDEIVQSLKALLSDEVTVSVFDRVWGTDKMQRLARVTARLDELHALCRFGVVEPVPGTGEFSAAESHMKVDSTRLALDTKLRADLVQGLAAGMSAGASAGTSRSHEMAESLKMTYGALAMLDFGRVAAELVDILEDLDTKAVVLLFDEWSAIPRDLQPAFAEMIRATLAAEHRVFVKFACIPFHTELSGSTEAGDTVGYAIGEEVFVDADLDRLFSSWGNGGDTSAFLLSVLHKHLGNDVHELGEMTFAQAVTIFNGQLFANGYTISELVSASAGIPRDFLRIFVRSYRSQPDELPIGLQRMRDAIHEFYTSEKTQRLGATGQVERKLFDAIFQDICVSAHTPFFFVSTRNGTNQVLHNLWDRRLVHLLYTDYFAYADGRPGTYDVYVMDYGRFVSMRRNTVGDKIFRTGIGVLRALGASLGASGPTLPAVGPGWEKALEREKAADIFVKLMAGVDDVHADIEAFLEDVSRVVADRLLP